MITFNKGLSRAPSDCLQYFTGKTGTVYSYNFAGAQVLRMFFFGNVEDKFLLSSYLEWIIQTVFGRRRATVPLSGRRRRAQLQVAEMRVDIWIDFDVHCWLTVPSLVSFVLRTVLRSKLDDLDNHNNISDDDNNLMRATCMMFPIFADPFQVFATASTAVVLACPSMQVYVPNMRLLCHHHHELRHEFHCDYESHQKTKNKLRLFNVSYDGIKTLGASAPTASTAATYQYQSRTFHLFKMIQNTRRTWM